MARALFQQPAYLEHARDIPTSILINKIDDEQGRHQAKALLAAMQSELTEHQIVRVLWRGRAQTVETIWQRPPRERIAAVLLAAGTSSRFGSSKPAAQIDGEPMIARAARALLADSIDALYVVVGHESERVRDALLSRVEDKRVRFIENLHYADGMATSIVAGVQAVQNADACLIALADMPFLRTQTVDHLVRAFRVTPYGMIAPIHDGKRGHPVLFDCRYFEALTQLQGDRGASSLLHRRGADLLTVPVDDPGVLLDVDHATVEAS